VEEKTNRTWEKKSEVRFRYLVVYHLTLSRHQSHHVTDDARHQQV